MKCYVGKGMTVKKNQKWKRKTGRSTNEKRSEKRGGGWNELDGAMVCVVCDDGSDSSCLAALCCV